MVDMSDVSFFFTHPPPNSSVISPRVISPIVNLQGRGDITFTDGMEKLTAEEWCNRPDILSSAVEVAFESQVLERLLMAIRLFSGDVDQGWRIEHGVLRLWPVDTVDRLSDASSFKSLDAGILGSGGEASFPCEALITFGASLLGSSADWVSMNPVLSSILIILFGFHVTALSVVLLWALRDFLRCRSLSDM